MKYAIAFYGNGYVKLGNKKDRTFQNIFWKIRSELCIYLNVVGSSPDSPGKRRFACYEN